MARIRASLAWVLLTAMLLSAVSCTTRPAPPAETAASDTIAASTPIPDEETANASTVPESTETESPPAGIDDLARAREDCEQLAARLVADRGWAGETSLFLSNGTCFLFCEGEWIELSTFDSPEEAAAYGLQVGDYKLYPYEHPLAGQYITVPAAEAADVAYVTLRCTDQTAAYICNYCAEVTRDGKRMVFPVCFASDSTPSDPRPLYEPDADDRAVMLPCGGTSATVPTLPTVIKNIILLIADGGGYDNFELANETKLALFKKELSSLGDTARTTLTNGRLSPYGYDNGTGLYLNNFLVGSSNTLLEIPHGSDPARQYITDSSAAGTALATGYKTAYCYAGIDGDRHPRASLSEMAQMNGMSTGIVSTKSFVDATPLAFFTSHSIHRYEYQDNSLQALLSGIDVVLVEGTEYGDIPVGGGASSHLGAREAGYVVVRNRTSLERVAGKGFSKVWGAFMGCNGHSLVPATADQAADYLSYDIDPTERDEPTLADMTAAALQMLDEKNNPNGFFLMIEAGALDNAAEGGILRYAVGEALAFDEVFADCVEWAKQHGDDTLVIATADHDSGGFWGIERRKNLLVNSLIEGQFPNKTPITVHHTFEDYRAKLNMGNHAGIIGGHSDMPVPVWLYAPAGDRAYVLSRLGISPDTTPDKIRHPDAGRYYDPEAINRDYLIDNTAFAPVLADLMGNLTPDEATAELYVPVATYNADGSVTLHSGIPSGTIAFGVPDTRTVGTTTVTYYPVTFACEDAVFHRNSPTYEQGGHTLSFEKIGDRQPLALYITTAQAGREGVRTGTFYLPRSVVEQLVKEVSLTD